MGDERIIGIDASRSYRPHATGTERYSRRLIEHMLALDSSHIRFRLYFNESPPSDAALGDAEIRTLPARRFWTHYRLSREMRSRSPDLLFVPSHVLPLVHPTRSVVTVHDLGYLYEPESHTRVSRLQLRLTTQWNARQATRIIAISEATKRDLIEHCGVEESRVAVVRHGVDERFRPLPKDEVERYRRAARLPERFILYLGTIQPRKNVHRLISAFEQLAERAPDVHLVLAGKTGWLAEPITRRAQESAHRDRIRFLGHVPDPQLPALFNTATAFALPSLYEGFGLPVLEAMACGTPTVMSNRGALPELAGADAIVVDPLATDHLAEALGQALDAARDTSAICARVEHAGRFRWDESARKTLAILEQMLENGSGGAR